MAGKIKVGISSCLLGRKVRYDGGHKLDRFLKNTLGRFVEWVMVCPETECGLSVPRERIDLAGKQGAVRLIGSRTGKDYTSKMFVWREKRIKELKRESLCGFIFKSRSPSCGLSGINLYNNKGFPYSVTGGIFASSFTKEFELIPVEDENSLHDPVLRRNFIEKIFLYGRWQDFMNDKPSMAKLVNFHTRHKFQIMSHSPRLLEEAARAVSSGVNPQVSSAIEKYFIIFIRAFSFPATPKKNLNVLQHIAGYLKKNLSSEENKELQEIFKNYHKGLLPLKAPLTLIRHYIQKYGFDYLSSQYYLRPYPLELMQ